MLIGGANSDGYPTRPVMVPVAPGIEVGCVAALAGGEAGALGEVVAVGVAVELGEALVVGDAVCGAATGGPPRRAKLAMTASTRTAATVIAVMAYRLVFMSLDSFRGAGRDLSRAGRSMSSRSRTKSCVRSPSRSGIAGSLLSHARERLRDRGAHGAATNAE